MKFYFSGIADKKTFALLQEAKVKHFLVDHADVSNIPQAYRIGMLDSGAYRAFKARTSISLRVYMERVRELHERCDLIVAPDVVGDCYQTIENWRTLVNEMPEIESKLIPVWQWNTPQDHLKFYLKNSALVGIGGLARIFHDDSTEEAKARREETLKMLLRLCQKLPGRFHIFGLNYLKGIQELAPYAYSCDTSCWLRGASKGYVIFEHSKTQRLTQAPFRAIPQYNRLDRAGRCILNASNIENFLAQINSRKLQA